MKQENENFEKYKEYALKTINKEIPNCEFMILNCKRYLELFENENYIFRAEKVDEVVKFISKLKHSNSENYGKPFILLDFQFHFICYVYGFYYRDNIEKRVIRNVYFELGRKNGKSAFMSAILLYELIKNSKSEFQGVNLANSYKQSKLLFEYLTNFTTSINKLNFIEQYRDNLKLDKGKIFCLANNPNKQDGLNVDFAILDEYHQATDNKSLEVIQSSQGSKLNPLLIIITTAGLSKNCVCYELRDNYIQNLYQNFDHSQATFIFTLDKDDDYHNPKNWIKSNPALDKIIKSEFLENQITKVDNNKNLEFAFLVKNMNLWLDNGIEEWIKQEEINKVSIKNFDISDKEYICHCGIDLGAVSDLTAISYCYKFQEEEKDKFYIKTDFYLPSSALEDNVNSELYKKWYRNKYLKLTEGNVTDYDYIFNDLSKNREEYNIDKIGFDQWNSSQFVIRCTSSNYNMIPVSQSIGNFNRGTKTLERLIKEESLFFEYNPIMNWCFANTTLKEDDKGNIKPIKKTIYKSSKSKIDGVISSIMSLILHLEQTYTNEILVL